MVGVEFIVSLLWVCLKFPASWWYNSRICTEWNQSCVATSMQSSTPSLIPFVMDANFLLVLLSSATLIISFKFFSQLSSPWACARFLTSFSSHSMRPASHRFWVSQSLTRHFLASLQISIHVITISWAICTSRTNDLLTSVDVGDAPLPLQSTVIL